MKQNLKHLKNMEENLPNKNKLVSDSLLDRLADEATISVDCKLHGKFMHSPIDIIPDGDCPECYFNDEILKETIIDDPNWIDKSKLH